MRREQKIAYDRIAEQVRRVRRIYSNIGEPLPADIIIELHRCLSPALAAVEAPRKKTGGKRLEA